MERKKMTEEGLAAELPTAAGWTAENGRLTRRFTFPDFATSLAFVNKVGEAADALDHHPDIKMGWGYTEIQITTHDRGGITYKDFELARTINDLQIT